MTSWPGSSRMPEPASAPKGAKLFQVIRKSFGLFRPEPGLLAFILAVNLLGAALTGIADPLSLKLLIDSLTRGDRRFFLLLSGALILIYLLFRVLSYVSDLFTQRLRNRLCSRLTSGLIQDFYRLPYSRVSQQDRGYFISRLYDEPAKVTEAVNLVVQLFSSLAICLCAIAVCFFLSWKVAILVSTLVPVLIVLTNRYGSRIRRTSLEESEAEARLREGLGRAVESYKNVKLFRLHKQVFHRMDGLLQGSLDATYTRFRHSAVFKLFSGTFLSLAESAVMIGSGYQVLQGELSVGGLFAFTSAHWRVIGAFQNLTVLIPAFTRLAAHLERIQELGDAAWEPAQGSGRFAVRGLAFGYEDRLVLEQFNLDLKPGEKILIVGPNGSGKSTLAHILSGFLEAREGEIELPGLDRTSALLSPFGFIPGNLADNLAHAESAEKQLALRRLSDLFGLAGKLDRDPDSFSDGEKKKAQIVMALMKDADLYLLDEPLANVDPWSKDAIMETIFSLTAGRGLIVILHGDDKYRGRFDRVVDLCPNERLAAVST